MMKHLMLCLSLVFCFTATVQSQNSRHRKEHKKVDESATKALIQLTDGSQYIGKFISQTSKEITLKLLTGDEITVDKTLAKRILTPENARIFKNGSYHRTAGFYFTTICGINGGDSGIGTSSEVGLGYRYSPKVEFTAEIGVMNLNNWFNANPYSIVVFPTTLGTRYNLTQGSAKLFAYGKVGYSFGREGRWNDSSSGGFHYNAGVGVDFASKRIGKSQIFFGQMMQFSEVTTRNQDIFSNPQISIGKLWMGRLKFGFSTTIN